MRAEGLHPNHLAPDGRLQRPDLMLLLIAVAFAALFALGRLYGFAAMRWAAVAFLAACGIALLPVLWTMLDETDRCLDSGGRWNGVAEVCER